MSNWKDAKKVLPEVEKTYLACVESMGDRWLHLLDFVNGEWHTDDEETLRFTVLYWCDIEEVPEEEGLFVLTQENEELFTEWIDASIADLNKVIKENKDNLFGGFVTRISSVRIKALEYVKEILLTR